MLGLTPKETGGGETTMLDRTKMMDKARDLAHQAKDRADDLAEKAGPRAAKGLDAAKTRLDKATHGKYHDTIENVSGKVERVLKREHHKPGGTDQT